MNVSQYQAYPEYKDAEMGWCDFLPQAWGRVSLRWISRMYAGGTPSKNVQEYWEDGTVPWLNSGAVNQGLVTEASTFITEEAFKNSSAKWIPKSALVIALAGQGKTKGMVAQLDIDSTCNQSMAAIVPDNLFDSRFLFWWLTFNYQNIRNMSGGDNRDGLNLELLGSIECPIPEDEEKVKISNFLDYETNKIDSLVEKQQALILLLQEKRQGVISHAVTKGLNPDTTMRDSGVEWLGEVPEHWGETEIRYITKQMGGGTPNKERLNFWNGDIPWVSPKDMKVDHIYDTQDKITKEAIQESSAKLVPAGSVLIVVRGMILVHSVPVALTQLEVTINQDMKALIPEKNINGEFLLFFMKGLKGLILDLVEESAHGTKCLRSELFDRMKIAVPEYSEQIQIVTKLKERIGVIDSLIEKANCGVELLNERRTALISAAVTGKIDVRNWKEA